MRVTASQTGPGHGQLVPELPEVETIRRQLEAKIVGDSVESVALLGSRVQRRGSTDGLQNWIPERVVGVDRVGKFLAIRMLNGSALVMHLGMSGHLRLSTGERRAMHTQCSLTLASGQVLDFVDPRTFGELIYVAAWSLDPPHADVLSHIGVDLLMDAATVLDRVSARFSQARRPVKAFIMDQRMMAGLGNMYADEALYRAGIHPEEPCARLGNEGLRSLVAGIHRVLDEAIAFGGSTFEDRGYRNLEGEGGYYPYLLVYRRQLRRCLLCYSVIERVRYQGRYSHFCPQCQRRLS